MISNRTLPGLVQQRGPGKQNFLNQFQSKPWRGGGVAGGGQARTGHGNRFMSINPYSTNSSKSVILPNMNNFPEANRIHMFGSSIKQRKVGKRKKVIKSLWAETPGTPGDMMDIDGASQVEAVRRAYEQGQNSRMMREPRNEATGGTSTNVDPDRMSGASDTSNVPNVTDLVDQAATSSPVGESPSSAQGDLTDLMGSLGGEVPEPMDTGGNSPVDVQGNPVGGPYATTTGTTIIVPEQSPSVVTPLIENTTSSTPETSSPPSVVTNPVPSTPASNASNSPTWDEQIREGNALPLPASTSTPSNSPISPNPIIPRQRRYYGLPDDFDDY